jgi:hypothetical protein
MVKPEITFFTFVNRQVGSSLSHPLTILNKPPTILFAGLSRSALIDTFNLSRPSVFHSVQRIQTDPTHQPIEPGKQIDLFSISNRIRFTKAGLGMP